MYPRKPYRGVLRRKMPSADDVSMAEWVLAWRERIVALADHYGLDLRLPGTLEALTEMGLDHVEAFQIAKKPGRKPARTPAQDIVLVVEVLQGREKGQNDTRAYRRIAKWSGVKEDEIEKAVTTLRKRFNTLTQPKTEGDRRASMRMRRMIRLLGKEEQKSNRKSNKVVN